MKVARTVLRGERSSNAPDLPDHRIVVWGRQAETCQQYLAKGRQVYIEGRLQTRSYEDREGVKRYATEIVAQQVQFLGGKGATGTGQDDPEPGANG